VAALAHSLAGDLWWLSRAAGAGAGADPERGAVLYCRAMRQLPRRYRAGRCEAGKDLIPVPSLFTMQPRAPTQDLRTLSGHHPGLEDTAMVSSKAFSDDRWALAFHVGSLAFTPAQVEEGQRLWNDTAPTAPPIPDLKR